MKHLIKLEVKKALNRKFLIYSVILILFPLVVILTMVNGEYAFFRPIEVHSEILGSVIALLFPLLLVPLNASSYADEKKDDFITYIKPRIYLKKYIVAKGIVNFGLTFIVGFLLIFIPFVFLQYIDPLFHFVIYIEGFYQPVSVGTFEFLTEHSYLTYGIVYSLWVGLNGALYASIAFLASIIINNKFIALSIPFVWYFVMNFVTAILGIEMFSPVFTIFPNISAQPIWTIFVPFSVLVLIIIGKIVYIKSKKTIWVD